MRYGSHHLGQKKTAGRGALKSPTRPIKGSLVHLQNPSTDSRTRFVTLPRNVICVRSATDRISLQYDIPKLKKHALGSIRGGLATCDIVEASFSKFAFQWDRIATQVDHTLTKAAGMMKLGICTLNNSHPNGEETLRQERLAQASRPRLTASSKGVLNSHQKHCVPCSRLHAELRLSYLPRMKMTMQVANSF